MLSRPPVSVLFMADAIRREEGGGGRGTSGACTFDAAVRKGKKKEGGGRQFSRPHGPCGRGLGEEEEKRTSHPRPSVRAQLWQKLT